MRKYPEITDIDFYQVANCRIGMMRNMCVMHAQECGADVLLFIDPDTVPDCYLRKDRRARPFWHEAWTFLKANPGSIVAAPYCGTPPESPVHVFSRNEQGNVKRLSRERAQGLDGWYAVDAVGTGLMLMDMAVFEKLDQPYFRDVYTDQSGVKLRYSQDVDFCLRCRAAEIPIYANFSCWAGHWQLAPVGKPGWQEPVTPEEPIKVATNPSVPVLEVAGEGDKAWQ